MAAVDADLLLIGAPEACVRNGNAGSFAAPRCTWDMIGWAGVRSPSAPPTRICWTCQSPPRADLRAGTWCSRWYLRQRRASSLRDWRTQRLARFLPGARVTCVVFFIIRGHSPFLIGLRCLVQFERSVLGVLVHEVRSLAREARGHHANWLNCCGPGFLRRRGRLEHGTPNPRDAVSDGLMRNPIQSPRFRFLHG